MTNLFGTTLVLSLSWPVVLADNPLLIAPTLAQTLQKSGLLRRNANIWLSSSEETRFLRKAEAVELVKQGNQYYRHSQYQQALQTYQQVLAIYLEIGDSTGEAVALHLIGAVYNQLDDYSEALKFYRQSLAIYQAISYNPGEARILNSIGAVYQQQGLYDQALEYYQQSLTLRRNINDRVGAGETLTNLGTLYYNQGQYAQSLALYQQAKAIFQELNNQKGVGAILNNLGLVHHQLGEYEQALVFYQQSLVIRQGISDRSGVGATLHNMGFTYDRLEDVDQALVFYQQALAVRTSIGDQAGEAKTLNNLGLLYHQLGQKSSAKSSLEQALAISQAIGDRSGVGSTLDSLGTVYQSWGKYVQALQFYQQGLAIKKEVGDRTGERLSLSNIAGILEQQHQPELAIIFYKQSVNVTEAIRQDLQGLSQEQQQSYTETIADTYRQLADLLLKQDRVLEAQQVLDLLKVQELEDYLRNVRGNEQTAQGIASLPPEKEIFDQYAAMQIQAIQIGIQLSQLAKIPAAERTSSQQQHLIELRQREQEIIAEFNNFLDSSEIIALVEQLSQTTRRQNLDLVDLNSLRDNLPANTALFYPLILEDRLELILTTPNAPPTHRPIPIQREELNQLIVQLRRALTNPEADATVPAQQLYELLIQPLATVLREAQVQTLIYAPDGQLRYLPLAALYDGQQWLIERYRINNITAKSLTDFATPPPTQLRILAAAFTEGHHVVQVGNQQFAFTGLPFAGQEVATLAATVPGTFKLLNREFSPPATVPHMNDYSVVHLATHAAFLPGQPEDSFILFGDGSFVTLREVRNWSLNNVDLVVLSGCETGLGGKLGNGEEILGLGYQIQRAGAKGAIASLWSVNDHGTQILMNTFYNLLQQGNITKAEALQQAQVAIIANSQTAVREQRGTIILETTGAPLPSAVKQNLSHPYYWAPFILIGNGF
ncbi:MAG: tetratricopeptide repeat protein [Symploca sp. SIO2D2]|nr:tetratricopeptide repeat protein [Symploca sp. SIO2D2]